MLFNEPELNYNTVQVNSDEEPLKGINLFLDTPWLHKPRKGGLWQASASYKWQSMLEIESNAHTHCIKHMHTQSWWQLRESDMPAITTGECMFILLTCHRFGGRVKEKEEKKLSVCVHTVTCKCTQDLKCLCVPETFQVLRLSVYLM